jgi:hypothetical protein
VISRLTAVAALLGSLHVCACDAEGGGEGNPCERAEAAKQQAADDYCVQMAALCCYCSCWEGTGYYDVEAYLDDLSCDCLAPPADETSEEVPCEGDLLEDAEACLDDLDACTALHVAEKQIACEATPI